jgi:hypothetical protein
MVYTYRSIEWASPLEPGLLYCDYTTGILSNYTHQIKSKHGKGAKDKKCPKCDDATFHTKSLLAHIKAIHDDIKDNTCAQCNFISSSRGSVSRHIKSVHNKIKDHKCIHCDYAAQAKSTLAHHVNVVHEKIKDYIPDVSSL